MICDVCGENKPEVFAVMCKACSRSMDRAPLTGDMASAIQWACARARWFERKRCRQRRAKESP